MKALNVNLGCGSNVIPSWKNVDAFFPFEQIPENLHKWCVEADARELPFKSGTVDYILMDQVLEHISMEDIPAVLFEVKRVLKKGGRLVICVPDFRSALMDWLSVDHDKSFEPFVFKYLSEVIYGNQIHEGEYHRTPMTPGFLNYLLHMVGLHDYEMTMYTKLAPVPSYPGMRSSEGAKCRNAQLVVDVKKS